MEEILAEATLSDGIDTPTGCKHTLKPTFNVKKMEGLMATSVVE